MNHRRWVLFVLLIGMGWFTIFDVAAPSHDMTSYDPLRHYEALRVAEAVIPLQEKKVFVPDVVVASVTETAQATTKKKSDEEKSVIDEVVKNVDQKYVDDVAAHIDPKLKDEMIALEAPNEENLVHINLNAHVPSQADRQNTSGSDVSQDEKLQSLLSTEAIPWSKTIDQMSADMLALSHQEGLMRVDPLDLDQELELLALSHQVARLQEKPLDLDQTLEMLALADALENEVVYEPHPESGEMVLATLALSDGVLEDAHTMSDDMMLATLGLSDVDAAFFDTDITPDELALLALNDTVYPSHTYSREKAFKPTSAYASHQDAKPRAYAKQKGATHQNKNPVMQTPFNAALAHSTHSSKRHRSSRVYALTEKGEDQPRYATHIGIPTAATLPLANNLALNLDVKKTEMMPMEDLATPELNPEDGKADLDLFAAPILMEDEPMLMADAEMARAPEALFPEHKPVLESEGSPMKVSGNMFYSTRLKTGLPLVGSRLSFKPYDKWVFRVGAKTTLFGKKKDFSYSWGLGYEDWRPGQFSFALNNWGPIRLGQDPLKGLKFSVDYNIAQEIDLFGFPISFSPAIDLPLKASPNLGRWAPTVGLGHKWAFKDSWFVKIGVSRALSSKAPWRWTYGFGRNSWKPFTFNVVYSNWGPNRDFRPNFRKNGRLTVQWKWMMEY